jgi:hypothetical protein
MGQTLWTPQAAKAKEDDLALNAQESTLPSTSTPIKSMVE